MAKELDLKAKGVSFNIKDDHQRELWEYSVSKSNFSSYVKGLILRDMLGIGFSQPKPEQRPIEFDLKSFTGGI